MAPCLALLIRFLILKTFAYASGARDPGTLGVGPRPPLCLRERSEGAVGCMAWHASKQAPLACSRSWLPLLGFVTKLSPRVIQHGVLLCCRGAVPGGEM